MRAKKEAGPFLRGISLFNAAKFFEAHEAWEELWLIASGAEKKFLQGLIQLAAALHHHGRQNRAGTESLITAGLVKLAEFPSAFKGIELATLLRDAKKWFESRAQTGPTASKYPKIKLAVRTNRKTKRGR